VRKREVVGLNSGWGYSKKLEETLKRESSEWVVQGKLHSFKFNVIALETLGKIFASRLNFKMVCFFMEC